jgi:ubiquinone/menaquinone biosynthesis C-methylase UbiE
LGRQEEQVVDPRRTSEFYGWQIENGVIERFGERTNWDAVARLAGQTCGTRDILDLGCSTGAVAQELSRREVAWRRYVGLDICEIAIRHFRERRLAGTEPKVADATDLTPFDDQSFDLVMVLFLLQDLPMPTGKELLRSIPRILRATGSLLLALTVHSDQSSELGTDYRPKLLQAAGIPGKYTYLWSKPDLESIVREVGLVKGAEHENATENGLVEGYYLWAMAAAEQR